MSKILPYWKYIIAGIIIIGAFYFFWSGKASAYYEQLKQSILADQIQIQKELEDEVNRLDQERIAYIKELARLKAERLSLYTEREQLKRKINEIENRLANIPVPADLDSLARKFKERGYRPMLRP